MYQRGLSGGDADGKKAIVRRYDETGKELQSIESLSRRRRLYSYPHYITENINGDICTSDYNKRADKSGRYRFSYTGHDQGSVFHPFGICTDILGRIIVCSSKAVDILDEDGRWLSALPTPQQKACVPRSVCVHDENKQEKVCVPRSVCVHDENKQQNACVPRGVCV